jgi:trigger factor
MRATAEPIEGNKVRLTVEVDEPDVDKVLDDMVRQLSRQARVPGFRPGKVPRRVLEARMGGAVALRSEALREALPDFYAQAVADADVDPIAPPEIDITAGEESGPLAFDAVVEVRPIVAIPGYNGLRVTVPSPRARDEDVEARLDQLRETDAELVTVSRPARDGDNLTIDLHGTGGDGEELVSVDDYLYELGSGRVVPELDQQLRGAKVGDILTFSATTPDGTEIAFRVLVKEVQEKKLPELTDEWASESSEFATVEELRADLRARLDRVKAVQSQLALRERAVEALVGLVDDEVVPEVLVDEEVRQRVHDLGHRLEEQRISLEQLLAASGRTGDDLLAEIRVDALAAVKADLALRALAEAESLEVSDEELDTELAATAQRLGTDPEELRSRLDRAGRTAAVRSEQKKAKAMTWLLDHVELVDEEGNPVSRDDLRVDQSELEVETPGAGESVAEAAPKVTTDEADEVGDIGGTTEETDA